MHEKRQKMHEKCGKMHENASNFAVKLAKNHKIMPKNRSWCS
jgi:hypothetical protein